MNPNPEGTMREKRADPLDDHRMNAIGIQLDARIAVVYRIKTQSKSRKPTSTGSGAYVSCVTHCSARGRFVKQKRFGPKPWCTSDRTAVRSRMLIVGSFITDSMTLQMNWLTAKSIVVRRLPVSLHESWVDNCSWPVCRHVRHQEDKLNSFARGAAMNSDMARRNFR